MSDSKRRRRKAIATLAALSRGKRDSAEASIPEVYPYGLFASEPRNPAYDRDIVISAVAALEQALEESILTKLLLREDADNVLFLEQQPLLRDLHDKARMAYLLGVIGPLTAKDVTLIRSVRNAFAHTRVHLDLDMPEFVAVISFISAPDRWPTIIDGHQNQDSRERFIQTCFQLTMYLAVGVNNEQGEVGRIMQERQQTFQQ